MDKAIESLSFSLASPNSWFFFSDHDDHHYAGGGDRGGQAMRRPGRLVAGTPLETIVMVA